MAFTIAQFRLDFPEFTDTAIYTNAMITFWSTIATQQVNACLWGNLTVQGIELYTAHEIAIQARDIATAANGGYPGGSSGIANAKTVGNTSLGYDAATTTEPDAGYWNQTTYGKQFIHLARLFGTGGIQVGVGSPWYGPAGPWNGLEGCF